MVYACMYIDWYIYTQTVTVPILILVMPGQASVLKEIHGDQTTVWSS